MVKLLDWCDPLDFVQHYAGYEPLVFLHSSLKHPQYGRYSILAVNEKAQYKGNNWQALRQIVEESASSKWQDIWFGYISYEMGQEETGMPVANIALPRCCFMQFHTVFVFDHQQHTLIRYGKESPTKPMQTAQDALQVTRLDSRMAQQDYLSIIEKTRGQIEAGEFYQANITRKITGRFAQPADPSVLFRRLCEASPACYSALIRLEGNAILSSSPECFMTIDAQGRMEARPIKGTAPKNLHAEVLQLSEKDRAENLMIVDLMRHDMAQHSEIGSVQVKDLFEVTSYSTLHHMASTVQAKRHPDASSLQVIEGCFPPGSMTGAPKKAVMQWCAEQEAVERGVYSGALGWIAADGSLDLSVVIRTLLLCDSAFEFQVGGGIVYDSEPLKEWQETLTKAQGILRAIGVYSDEGN